MPGCIFVLNSFAPISHPQTHGIILLIATAPTIRTFLVGLTINTIALFIWCNFKDDFTLLYYLIEDNLRIHKISNHIIFDTKKKTFRLEYNYMYSFWNSSGKTKISIITRQTVTANTSFNFREWFLCLYQKIQNKAARLVLRKDRKHDSKELLRLLHWLPVQKRIDFKIACLVFKSLNNLSPYSRSNWDI